MEKLLHDSEEKLYPTENSTPRQLSIKWKGKIKICSVSNNSPLINSVPNERAIYERRHRIQKRGECKGMPRKPWMGISKWPLCSQNKGQFTHIGIGQTAMRDASRKYKPLGNPVSEQLHHVLENRQIWGWISCKYYKSKQKFYPHEQMKSNHSLLHGSVWIAFPQPYHKQWILG